MELDFSKKGLATFDASHLGRGVKNSVNVLTAPTSSNGSVEVNGLSSLLDHAPVVKGINLSHNAIHMFIGGETLRHVVALDLSHNALSVLNTKSLPPSLLKLNVSHNSLRELGGLAAHVPTLQELDISHNAFTASGIRDFPPSLVTLQLQKNEVDSLGALQLLKRLTRLNVSENRLETADSLEALRALPCLHHLELRGNGVVSSAVGACPNNEGGRATASLLLCDLAPQLITLDGLPLSQAPANSKYKASQAAVARASHNASLTHLSTSAASRSTRQVERSSLNGSGTGAFNASSRLTHSRSIGDGLARKAGTTAMTNTKSRISQSPTPSPPPMEVRLMEAKVSELRRLLTESEKKENQDRYECGILVDQIRSCGGVIDAQAVELESLQKELAQLEEEERVLRGPVAAMEQTFEHTHASLLAQKVELLGGGTEGKQASALC